MVPPSPTVHTSPAPISQTPERKLVVPLETLNQELPFQWRISPAPPTAQASLDPLPRTPLSHPGPLRTVDQALPFQRRMVPPSPTAQTSFAELPHTAYSGLVPVLVTLDQLVPFQCRMVRLVHPPPTAQTSLGPLPQTP